MSRSASAGAGAAEPRPSAAPGAGAGRTCSRRAEIRAPLAELADRRRPPQALAPVVEQAAQPVDDGGAALTDLALLRLVLEHVLEVLGLRVPPVAEHGIVFGIATGGAAPRAARRWRPSEEIRGPAASDLAALALAVFVDERRELRPVPVRTVRALAVRAGGLGGPVGSVRLRTGTRPLWGRVAVCVYVKVEIEVGGVSHKGVGAAAAFCRVGSQVVRERRLGGSFWGREQRKAPGQAEGRSLALAP